MTESNQSISNSCRGGVQPNKAAYNARGDDHITVEKSWDLDIRGMAHQFDNRQSVGLSSTVGGDHRQTCEELCSVCSERVYILEKLVANKRVYHKSCVKCHKCRRPLGVDFVVYNDELYCKPHFSEMFKIRGRYDENEEVIIAKEKEVINSPPLSINEGPQSPSCESLDKVFDDRSVIPPLDATRSIFLALIEAAANIDSSQPASQLSTPQMSLSRRHVSGVIVRPSSRGGASSSLSLLFTGMESHSNMTTPTASNATLTEIMEQPSPEEGKSVQEDTTMRTSEMPPPDLIKSLVDRFRQIEKQRRASTTATPRSYHHQRETPQRYSTIIPSSGSNVFNPVNALRQGGTRLSARSKSVFARTAPTADEGQEIPTTNTVRNLTDMWNEIDDKAKNGKSIGSRQRFPSQETLVRGKATFTVQNRRHMQQSVKGVSDHVLPDATQKAAEVGPMAHYEFGELHEDEMPFPGTIQNLLQEYQKLSDHTQ